MVREIGSDVKRGARSPGVTLCVVRAHWLRGSNPWATLRLEAPDRVAQVPALSRPLHQWPSRPTLPAPDCRAADEQHLAAPVIDVVWVVFEGGQGKQAARIRSAGRLVVGEEPVAIAAEDEGAAPEQRKPAPSADESVHPEP